MKPIHFIILGLAAALLLFAFLYDRKKRMAGKAEQQKKLMEGAWAITSITTVVDPTTGQEYIISNLGENNLDNVFCSIVSSSYSFNFLYNSSIFSCNSW